MDQGAAAVWAAGLGIAGTLVAGLCGPLLQARAASRQARAQEAVDIRLRLRDERRAAYAALLDQYEVVQKCLAEISEVHRFDAPREIDQEEWRQMNEVLDTLQRAATNVAITGPARIAELADTIHAQALTWAEATRRLRDNNDRSSLQMSSAAILDMNAARRKFVAEAQRAMAPPE